MRVNTCARLSLTPVLAIFLSDSQVDKAAAPPRRALLIDGSPLEKSAAPGKVGSEEGERKEGPEGENIKTGGGEGEEEGEGGRTPVLKSPPLPRAASARAPRTVRTLRIFPRVHVISRVFLPVCTRL